MVDRPTVGGRGPKSLSEAECVRVEGLQWAVLGVLWVRGTALWVAERAY